jgi:hypothetical protein
VLTHPGTLFPIIGNQSSRLQLPSWLLFGIKHFGTGVIIATPFIHVLLLRPARVDDVVTAECI